MVYLGLGGSAHDFSTCLCENGKILAYIEEDRISRKKHSFYLYEHEIKMRGIDYFEERMGISRASISHVIANNILLKSFYEPEFSDNVFLINHHLSHAYSAFYPSEFDNAAILIMDGAGDFVSSSAAETTSFWVGEKNKIDHVQTICGECISKDIFCDLITPLQNSIGGFYRAITSLLGFGLFGEGKVMGLASYGDDKLYTQLRNLVDFGDDGEFFCNNSSYEQIISLASTIHSFENKARLAYALQAITEEAVLNSAKAIKRITGCHNLCIAGGVGLNSVANYKLYKSGLFEKIFIQPAAGDNGTAIGAALYGYYNFN